MNTAQGPAPPAMPSPVAALEILAPRDEALLLDPGFRATLARAGRLGLEDGLRG